MPLEAGIALRIAAGLGPRVARDPTTYSDAATLVQDICSDVRQKAEESARYQQTVARLRQDLARVIALIPTWSRVEAANVVKHGFGDEPLFSLPADLRLQETCQFTALGDKPSVISCLRYEGQVRPGGERHLFVFPPHRALCSETNFSVPKLFRYAAITRSFPRSSAQSGRPVDPARRRCA